MKRKGLLMMLCTAALSVACMASVTAEETVQENESMLMAGASKVSITPPEEMWGEMALIDGNTPEGAYNDLFVRSLVIDNGEKEIAVVVFEKVDIEVPELKSGISEATGIPIENLILTATHNHTDVYGGEEYDALILEKAIESVEQAEAALQPAKYGYGEGNSYININRDKQQEEGYWMQDANPEGYSDKTLAMIKFVDMDDNLIAVFMNYCMHPMAAYDSVDVDGKHKMSGNITGVTCDYIEDRYEGAVALWTIGAAGNQNPYMIASPTYYYDGYPEMKDLPDGAGLAIMELQGQQHALDAIKILNTIECTEEEMPISFEYTTIELPAQKAPEGADMAYNRLLADNLVRKVTGATEIPERKLVTMEDDPDNPVQMHMQLAVLGDIALVGVPAEIYCEIGRDMKEASLLEHTIIMEFTDEYCGYILDKGSADKDVFQSFSSVKPGSSDELIINGMLSMENSYLEKAAE